MQRLFAVLIIIYTQAFVVFGQKDPIDSLTKALEATNDGQQQADILIELSISCYDLDLKKGFDYASKAYALASDLKYAKGMRRALTLQGFYYYGAGDYAQALQFYRRSSNVPLPDDEYYGYNLVMAGNTFRAMGQYDSAEIHYQQAIDVLTKVNAVKNLAFGFKNLGRLFVLKWKNKEAKEAFENALAIYEKTGNKFGVADTWFSLSDVSKNEAQYNEANAYTERACGYADSAGSDYLKLQCMIKNGELQYRIGDYAKALSTFFAALKIMESQALPQLQADLFSNLGDTYEALGQNDVSLKYFLEALKIAERIGINHEIAKIYSNVAWIYKNQLNFEMAHDYIKRSLDLRKKIKDDHGISNCFNVLGVIYMQQKKYSDAIASLKQSLEIRQRIGHREGISACLFNLALVFEEQKQYQKALEYQLQALAMDEAIGNKFSVGISYNSLGSLYIKLKKFPQAEISLKQAKKAAAETGSRSLQMNNLSYWSAFYEARKDPKKALQYYKRYAAVNDSIYNEVSAHKLAEVQALYQMEKKDQQIEFLNQQKLIQENQIQLQRSEINLQRIIIISGIGGFIMVSLLAFLTYKYNRRVKKAHREISEQKEEIQAQSEELIDANQTIAEINKKLEERIGERTTALSQAYKELDTFFYRASHDFRRPLTTFLGLAEVAKITVKDANALELFDKVRETASNLDKMLVKLQSISDVGSQQLVYKEVMIKEIFETVCDNFRDELKRKNIKTNAEIRFSDKFISYPAMVKIIIENLVENAIHFSGVVNPFIKMTAVQNGDYVTIDMQDNGQGISKEYQEQVFEMYFRANERSKGNGLGLYIVKKAVEKLDGSISLSSIPMVGSTFTVMLPTGRVR